jgi:preprotein translocase subunit YajC
MGNFDLAATGSSGSGSYTFLIVIVVLFGLLYFVMIRPQRNRQRQAQEMQRSVQPGQRVRTTAGMYATVVEADDHDVVLEVAPGVQIRFLRRAIMDTVPDDEPGDGTAPGYPADTDETAQAPAAADTPEAAAEPGPAAGEAGPDGQLGAEHRNGSGPGGAAAGHTAQDERSAD